MTLKKLLGHNERTGFSDTAIIFCAFLTGAGISALGISLCLLILQVVKRSLKAQKRSRHFS
jgi:hypothetical protein